MNKWEDQGNNNLQKKKKKKPRNLRVEKYNNWIEEFSRECQK